MTATTLRALFDKPGIVQLMGAHNALSARLVERAGFDGVWSSGLEISTSHAVPDANILTMSEYLAAAESMAEACSIPVVVDCDTGYGNSSNVIHMVRKFEAAGVGAVCIEDKLFPKVNSLFAGGRQELAPVYEFVGKILAATNARRDPDFMVIARVEALIAGWGQQEALDRARAYADAGADAILIHSRSSTVGQIAEFIAAWDFRAPLVVVPTTYSAVTAAELEALGVKMVIYANHGVRSAISAMEETFAEVLRAGSTAGVESRIASMQLVFDLQGMPQFTQDEKTYLRSADARPRTVIPAAGDHMDEYSMKHIAADIPMAMLDINGRSLLQRQVEVLSRAGVTDVTVIGGYQADRIQAEGVRLAINPDWRSTGIAYSFLQAHGDADAPTLMIFSDILFDQAVLDRLLRSEKDITLLVDRTFRTRARHGAKRLDIVEMANPRPAEARTLDLHATQPVRRIGKGVDPGDAHGEFIGLAYFSERGYRLFREGLRSLASGNTPTQPNASFTDVVQAVIDQGHEVSCVEVSEGWMEIHSFDDYRDAIALVSGPNTGMGGQ